MVPEIRTFQYKLQDVRVILIDGDPWFVETDVRRVLGLSGGRSTRRILSSEKGSATVATPGGPQELNILSESGFYKMTMRSDKPEAEPFQNWVTGEVLPTIRKTGRYEMPATAQPAALSPDIQAILQITANLAQATQAIMSQARQQDEAIGVLGDAVVSIRQDVDALKVQRVLGTGYVSVLGYARNHKASISHLQAQAIGTKAAKRCQQLGFEIGKVPDERWGTVNSYPEHILDEIWPQVMGE